CSASRADRFVTNERPSARHTRTIFVQVDLFYHKIRTFLYSTQTVLNNWDPTTVLDIRALRVDPIRSCGLLSPNMRIYLPLVCRRILMHYYQIPKEHQRKVGM